MNSPIFGLQIEKPKNVAWQITGHIQRLIASGELRPGQKLPPTQELAAKWGTHPATIQLALTPLVKQGLLLRRPGLGTFVAAPMKRLTCVGIYHCQENWAQGSSAFERAVHAALAAELRRRKISMRVWIDPRPAAERQTPWTELRRAVENREIQGLISMPAGAETLRWQNKLPLPTAFVTSADVPNKVDANVRQLAELSLEALAKQGCRSVGLICQVSSGGANPAALNRFYLDFYEHFLELTRELGLTLRNEWMRVPGDAEERRWLSQDQYGYREFLELWHQTRRPDGLIVYPDASAQGVILGLREEQVRVPQQLKLVLHKNESISLLCPMLATLLVSSERAFACALIEQVEKQFRGEPCTPITLPFRQVVHRGNC